MSSKFQAYIAESFILGGLRGTCRGISCGCRGVLFLIHDDGSLLRRVCSECAVKVGVCEVEEFQKEGVCERKQEEFVCQSTGGVSLAIIRLVGLA